MVNSVVGALRYDRIPCNRPRVRSGAPRHLIHLYNAGLAQAGWPSEARIRVENIQGPVLLVSGRRDAMIDSTGMGEKVMARLRKHEHPFEFRHVISDDAGHHVGGPGYRKYEVTTRSGGVSQATAKAQDECWRALLAFLDEHVRRDAE